MYSIVREMQVPWCSSKLKMVVPRTQSQSAVLVRPEYKTTPLGLISYLDVKEQRRCREPALAPGAGAAATLPGPAAWGRGASIYPGRHSQVAPWRRLAAWQVAGWAAAASAGPWGRRAMGGRGQVGVCCCPLGSRGSGSALPLWPADLHALGWQAGSLAARLGWPAGGW